LIDAGTDGYKPGEYRDWVRSHGAHNVVTIAGAGRLRNVATTLAESTVTAGWQRFEVEDRPYDGIERRRRVLHVDAPDEMFVVVDALRDARHRTLTYQQLWHLPHDVSATVVAGNRVAAVSADGQRTFHVIQVGFTGPSALLRAAQSPRQGWRSRHFAERRGAPTIVTDHRADGAAYVTVMLEAASGRNVTARIVRVGAQNRVRVTVGLASYDVVLGGNVLRPA
jgi:hypothetical protein